MKAGPASDFYVRAQTLFDDSATYGELAARIEAGAKIDAVPSTGAAATDIDDRLGPNGIPMFIHTPLKQLHVLVAGDRPPLEAGQELIGLTDHHN